jgi:hypothetical protein
LPCSLDLFGTWVAMSADGRLAAVAARFEGSAAHGVDGDWSDNGAGQAGAVHVDTFPDTGGWTDARVGDRPLAVGTRCFTMKQIVAALKQNGS